MTKEELYELIDIESGKDFLYFENIADLFETPENIGDDTLCGLLEEIDPTEVEELVNQYFDDMSEAITEAGTEVYTLMTNIFRVMTGMLKELERAREQDDSRADEVAVQLAEEINSFRSWYQGCPAVQCSNDRTGQTQDMTVLDALVLIREEKLGGDSYSMDFSRVLDYELTDYVVSVGDLYSMSGEGEES